MANMKAVNKGIKEAFGCDLGIKAVRGDGYVYFIDSGFDKIESIMTHPVSTSTEDMIRLCIDNIDCAIESGLDIYGEEL
jgi:hypothetical protein